MGGTLAAYLARAGHNVDVVDKSEAVVDAINRTGLTVTFSRVVVEPAAVVLVPAQSCSNPSPVSSVTATSTGIVIRA